MINTEFTFYEDGVEKKGKFVIALEVDNQKYVLFEMEENPNENNEDIIYVRKYIDDRSEKLELLPVSNAEIEKVRIRVQAIADVIE